MIPNLKSNSPKNCCLSGKIRQKSALWGPQIGVRLGTIALGGGRGSFFLHFSNTAKYSSNLTNVPLFVRFQYSKFKMLEEPQNFFSHAVFPVTDFPFLKSFCVTDELNFEKKNTLSAIDSCDSLLHWKVELFRNERFEWKNVLSDDHWKIIGHKGLHEN